MAAPPPNVEIHPATVRRYAAKVDQLQARLAAAAASDLDDATAAELVASVRELVDGIEVKPILQRRGGPYTVTVQGGLSHLLSGSTALPTIPMSGSW